MVYILYCQYELDGFHLATSQLVYSNRKLSIVAVYEWMPLLSLTICLHTLEKVLAAGPNALLFCFLLTCVWVSWPYTKKIMFLPSIYNFLFSPETEHLCYNMVDVRPSCVSLAFLFLCVSAFSYFVSFFPVDLLKMLACLFLEERENHINTGIFHHLGLNILLHYNIKQCKVFSLLASVFCWIFLYIYLIIKICSEIVYWKICILLSSCWVDY